MCSRSAFLGCGAACRLKKRGARLAVLDRYLRYVKYLVLAWAVGGSAYYGLMVFRDYDPWSALLNLAEFSFTPGIIVLGVTLVASFFIERPWCRYACPLGAASGLLGKAQPGLSEARSERLHFLQSLHQSLPDGTGCAHRDDHQKRGLHHLPGMCGRLPAQRRAGSQIRPARYREIRRADMRINPIIYGVIVLTVFFGTILGFQAAGIWSVSGKVDASGAAVQPSAADVDTIKGWMTLEQISTTYDVSLSDLVKQFDLPAETSLATAIKDLESEAFDMTILRDWLRARPAEGSAAPTPAAPAEPVAATPMAPSAATLTPAAAAEHAAPVNTITGKTTFQELLDWGVEKDVIQTAIGENLPLPSMLVKDYAASKGVEFATLKTQLQAEVDKAN